VVKNKFIVLAVINVVLIGLLVVFFAFKALEPSKKIVYVDNVKLFDGFIMTKEMKRVGEKEFNSRKKSLEVLYSKLQSQKISEDEKKILMQQFVQGKEELEQLNQSFAIEETSKIWSRIQCYTTEFSQENKYQLVIGSQNKQSVLFADEDIDVTNELLIYINKKYEGFK
jgi:outer membrane protein